MVVGPRKRLVLLLQLRPKGWVLRTNGIDNNSVEALLSVNSSLRVAIIMMDKKYELSDWLRLCGIFFASSYTTVIIGVLTFGKSIRVTFL